MLTGAQNAWDDWDLIEKGLLVQIEVNSLNWETVSLLKSMSFMSELRGNFESL